MPEDLQNFEYTRSWILGADPEDSFPTLNYLKDWRSSSDFITYQPSETQVREDMQALFEEIKNYINGDFRSYVVATGNAESYRIANEEARIANEEARVANENQRQANETVRQSNETTRQTQEAAREAAEAARANENSGIVAQATAQADRAAAAATRAQDYADRAYDNLRLATNAANAAEQSRMDAMIGADVASESAHSAGRDANRASASQSAAQNAAVAAQSYARGGTGTRSGENTDNAKYYKDQSKDIYDDVNERFQIGLDNGLLCAKTVPLTLLSSGWTESQDEPFSWVQTLTLSAEDAMAEAQAGVAYLPGSATKAQWTEAERCGLRVSGQTTASVTITAGIAKPTINIPIELALYIKPESMSAVYATQEDLEDLNASDVGAVPTSEKGAQNGVATLGSDGKIPENQIPLLRYLPPSARGAANGVASLDSNGKVPVAQIPDMGHVPNTRKVNGKALNADVTLSASDVGARANTWKPGVSDLAVGFILPLSMGGTGANSKAGAKAALEVPDLPVSVANGGTGAVNAAGARENLGIPDLTGIVKMKTVSGSAATQINNGTRQNTVTLKSSVTIPIPTDAIAYVHLEASVTRQWWSNLPGEATSYMRGNLFVDMTQKVVIAGDDGGDSYGSGSLKIVSIGNGSITLSGTVFRYSLSSDDYSSSYKNNSPLTYFVKYLTKE